MHIAVYISGHGLGHASRDIEWLGAIVARRPDARVVVRTSAPRWLFERTAPPTVDVQSLEADSGLTQIDSLRIDEGDTARRASAFYREFDRRVADEADFLRRRAVDVVVGDIPPLAFAAADRAGVPSIAIGNFTWDWIYGIYASFDRIAPDVIPTIRRAYATTTLALRLPLHGGFEPMKPVIRDIPFIARRSTRDRDDTRRRLGLTDDRPAVLVSFGGYGLQLPWDAIARSRFALIREDVAALDRHGLRYQDLVAAADVVVSKPGYGIVSECIANQTALLYTSRGRFVEQDVFVAEMPRFLRCRFMAHDDLFAGRWDEAVDALLRQPPPPERARVDGASVAAHAIAEIVGR